MKKFVNFALIFALCCAVGTACISKPKRTPTHTPSWREDGFKSGYAMINNTYFNVDVVQDGEVVARAMRPGQALSLKNLWLQRYSNVSVIAYDEGGSYRGTATYTFSHRVPETWTVTEIIPKGGRY